MLQDDDDDTWHTCAVIDSRPARIDVAVTGGAFGCKHVAAVYSRYHSPGSPDLASWTGNAPTATTDTGLAALTASAPRGSGGVRPGCAGDPVVIPSGGRSGFFTITSTAVWEVRARMSASTGWTAPPGRASGGPCGSSSTCGVLGTVELPWTAHGGNRRAPGI